MPDGIGCICAARSVHECACDVDWTPQETIDLRTKLAASEARVKELLEANKQLAIDAHVEASKLREALAASEAIVKELGNDEAFESCHCCGIHEHCSGVCTSCYKPVVSWKDAFEFSAERVQVYKDQLTAHQEALRVARDALESHAHKDGCMNCINTLANIDALMKETE